MGPQPFDCGNDFDTDKPTVQISMLQWGRSLSTAEISAGICRPAVAGSAASMGPQPFDCGNSSRAADGSANRGASMGPQPFDCGNDAHPVKNVYRRLRFNGAAAFRLRKFDPLLAHPLVAACASMGPQPFDCGNAHKVAADHRRAIDFNGAAAFRLRKCDPGAVAGRFARVLQWGRSLSTAEIRHRNPRFL